MIIEGFCKPKAGPAMHVHYKQDEALTVVKGKMGCQILGQVTGLLFRRADSHISEKCSTSLLECR